AQAYTVQSLINDYAITGCQVIYAPACFFDHATDLMAKNLRIDVERHRLTVLIRIVIGVTGEDMRVGAAKAHRRNPDHDIMRAGGRLCHIADLTARAPATHAGVHGTARLVSHRLPCHGFN